MSGKVGDNVFRASGLVKAVAAGRTGTVDWCTTAKTSPFTSETATGYFVNTTSGAITVTLPSSPSAGDIVALKDYAETWDSNAVTLGRGGSKINGSCNDATLDTEAQSVTMIYVDGTKGWQDIHDSTANVTGLSYICASGGTEITCGDFTTHVFTGDGTFCVASLSGCAAFNTVDYLVVGGGGSGGSSHGAGGGAGGFRYFSSLSPAGSPFSAPAGITVTASPYSISVGDGSTAPAPAPGGANGSVSTFSSICSAGGGGGGSYTGPGDNAGDGGSGGGGGNPGSHSPSPGPGGSGDTPPVTPPQGFDGGNGIARACASAANHRQGGGGGGAGAAGENTTDSTTGGDGGAGSYIPDGFFGPTAPSYGSPGPVSSTRYFAGGGGGGVYGPSTPGGSGGAGGGGAGGDGYAVNGTANTGGGGGGSKKCGSPCLAGSGGKGIVLIRYRYQ